MATKKICDRCGAEINPSYSGKVIEVYNGSRHDMGDRYELCVSCVLWLNKWLNNTAEIADA